MSTSRSQPVPGFRENLDRLLDLREKSAGHSVLKAAAFTIAAFDAIPALIAIAEAALPVVQLDAALDYDPDNELTTAQRINLDMRFTEAVMLLAERVAALSSEDATRPTPKCATCKDSDRVCVRGVWSECPDCVGRNATRPTGDKE